MTRLVAVEFFKLRKRMMTWVVSALLVGLVILMYSILWSVSGRVTTFGEEQQFTAEELRRALFLQTAVPFSLQVVALFGAVLAVILAAGAVGSEYSWGTIRVVATAASGRMQLMLAKLIVLAAFIAAGALLAVAVGVAYSSIITWANGGTVLDFVTRAFVRDQFYAYCRTLLVIAPYVSMAFAAAVIGRSTLAGVGAGIGFAFIEPLVSGLMRLASDPWQDIPNYLLNANTQVVLLENDLPEVVRLGPSNRELAERDLNSPEVATLILVGYIVAFLAAALITYRRRDMTAGS